MLIPIGFSLKRYKEKTGDGTELVDSAYVVHDYIADILKISDEARATGADIMRIREARKAHLTQQVKADGTVISDIARRGSVLPQLTGKAKLNILGASSKQIKLITGAAKGRVKGADGKWPKLTGRLSLTLTFPGNVPLLAISDILATHISPDVRKTVPSSKDHIYDFFKFNGRTYPIMAADIATELTGAAPLTPEQVKTVNRKRATGGSDTAP